MTKKKVLGYRVRATASGGPTDYIYAARDTKFGDIGWDWATKSERHLTTTDLPGALALYAQVLEYATDWGPDRLPVWANTLKVVKVVSRKQE